MVNPPPPQDPDSNLSNLTYEGGAKQQYDQPKIPDPTRREPPPRPDEEREASDGLSIWSFLRKLDPRHRGPDSNRQQPPH